MSLTDITLVVDRSGSMQEIRTDAQGGVNAFIERQKTVDGEAVLTLVQFDTVYEFVEVATPIKDVKPYRLLPRGGTALLDAVGRAIAETKERLAPIVIEKRPGIVVFVITTDGHENSSKEFKLDGVRKLITEQREAGWEFLFMGADDAAFAEASAMGIQRSHTMVTPTGAAVGQSYCATSEKLSSVRTVGATGGEISSGAFDVTDEERENLKKSSPTS
jgi:hypothetical protein